MTTVKLLITCSMILMLMACAVKPPTESELANADYGSSISQEKAKLIAQEYIEERLRDPNSAQYKWGEIKKTWISYDMEPFFCYVLEIEVNAKNGFGGYGGFKPYKFAYHNGKLKAAWDYHEKYGHWVQKYWND